jgi:DNA-binding MarR family transcriptional regulator
MGRPFRPETGLNRSLLAALAVEPGTPPGTLARTLGHDSSVVRDALARLESHGLVRVHPDGPVRRCYLTADGQAVERRHHRGDTERSPIVHSSVPSL